EQFQALFQLVAPAIKFGQVQSGPCPLIIRQLMLEKLFVFKRGGQIVIEVVSVDFRNARHDLQLVRVALKIFSQRADGVQWPSGRSEAFGFFQFRDRTGWGASLQDPLLGAVTDELSDLVSANDPKTDQRQNHQSEIQ